MAIGTNWAPWNNAPTTWQSTQQPSFASMQRPVNNILRAMGPESARAYPMGPNSDIVLFDANNPTFYMVSTDDSAFKSMRVFDFVERKQEEVSHIEEPLETAAFATKEDVDRINEKLAEIAKTLEGLV